LQEYLKQYNIFFIHFRLNLVNPKGYLLVHILLFGEKNSQPPPFWHERIWPPGPPSEAEAYLRDGRTEAVRFGDTFWISDADELLRRMVT